MNSIDTGFEIENYKLHSNCEYIFLRNSVPKIY